MFNNSLPHFVGFLASIVFAANAAAFDPVNSSDYDGDVRLACVGDSITQGVGAARGQSWPDQIDAMLGDGWEVGNFGRSGATLMNSGNSPYQKTPQFKKALDFKPDVVVIMLGTNDTKPNNWKKFGADYEKDYRDLIADFTALESKPRIFLCHPPYIAKDGNWGINDPNSVEQIPVIDAIAKDLKLEVIPVHAALKGRDELIPDKVHPNTGGAAVIAGAVFKGLIGKAAPEPASVE